MILDKTADLMLIFVTEHYIYVIEVIRSLLQVCMYTQNQSAIVRMTQNVHTIFA